jgi:hypothetical protein
MKLRTVLPLSVVLLGIAAFYTLTLRRGNFWADDYALYIHHAKNIVEGRPYADTGYVYNPDVADYSPRAYPPVFPLLLAPVYRVFGFNFLAMKFEVVIFFLLTLVVLSFYWSGDLRRPSLIALLLILGLSPIFWGFKDSIVADIPFLFFFYLVAWVTQSAPRNTSTWWAWAAVNGFLLYLCAGTRTIGLTLIPGFLLYELLCRKLTRFTAVSLVAFSAFLLVQRRLFGSGEQSYADQLHPTLSTVVSNAKLYSHDFMMLWTRSLGLGFCVALFLITTVVACYGFAIHLKHGLRALDVFLVPYLAMVLLWPAPQGIRFLLPVIPYYAYLMLLGLQGLPRFLPVHWTKVATATLLLLIATSYAAAFSHAAYGTIRQTDGRASFNDLCRFIENHTSPQDVFIFRRSRALSLFTSRPAATYDPRHDNHLATYLANIHANYIVSSPIFDEDRTILTPFIHSHPNQLTEVYENPDFHVYRVLYDSHSA